MQDILYVITGPTASGKTAKAVALARARIWFSSVPPY